MCLEKDVCVYECVCVCIYIFIPESSISVYSTLFSVPLYSTFSNIANTEICKTISKLHWKRSHKAYSAS